MSDSHCKRVLILRLHVSVRKPVLHWYNTTSLPHDKATVAVSFRTIFKMYPSIKLWVWFSIGKLKTLRAFQHENLLTCTHRHKTPTNTLHLEIFGGRWNHVFQTWLSNKMNCYEFFQIVSLAGECVSLTLSRLECLLSNYASLFHSMNPVIMNVGVTFQNW